MVKENTGQSRYKPKKRATGKAGMIVLWALFILMGGLKTAGAAGRTGSNYQIPADVFSGGGSACTSTSYSNQSSITQQGVVGSFSVSVSGLQAQHGFWPIVNEDNLILVGDVDQNGNIDIDDVFCLFKNIMGRSSCMDGINPLIFGDIDQDVDVDIDDVFCLFKNIMGRPSCMDNSKDLAMAVWSFPAALINAVEPWFPKPSLLPIKVHPDSPQQRSRPRQSCVTSKKN